MCGQYWALYLELVRNSRQFKLADGPLELVTLWAQQDHAREAYQAAAEALRSHAAKCGECREKGEG